MVVYNSDTMELLARSKCTVSKKTLKSTVDFIFEDNDRAAEFLRKTDPVVVVGIFQSMKETNEHNQDVIQNDQPENYEIGDNEIVTEAVLIEEQPEIQDKESGL